MASSKVNIPKVMLDEWRVHPKVGAKLVESGQVEIGGERTTLTELPLDMVKGKSLRLVPRGWEVWPWGSRSEPIIEGVDDVPPPTPELEFMA